QARAPAAQEVPTLAGAVELEAADLPPTGYRLRISHKIFRRVELRIYCKIWPWSRSSCTWSGSLCEKKPGELLRPAGQPAGAGSTKVSDRIREQPRPPTRPPPNRLSGGRRRPCKGSLGRGVNETAL